VRLALARLQPYSLLGRSLSRLVLLDTALFSPDPDLGWEDVPGRLYTLNPDVLLPGVGWRFRVNDVDVSAKPGNSCRLVIREFERDSRKAPFSTDHRQRLAFADSFIVF
jgi:hypothetical protein